MSYLKYNGVRIDLLKTASLEADRDTDKSRVDTLWQEYTIRARGTISRDSLQGPVTVPTAGRLTWRDLKHMLETPRAALEYVFAGDTILEWPGGPDAGMGIEPLPAVVHEPTEGTWFVEVGYILRVVDCEDNTDEKLSKFRKLPKAVVSLRWSQSESFDENWNSKVTTRGTLVVRADLRQLADSYRALCVPPVLNDYRRVTADYVMNPAGTELDFTFVDVEEDRLPPYPAIKAEGRFNVVIQRPGLKRIGQVDITLTGAKGTGRGALMVRAFGMAMSKLQSEGLEADFRGNPVNLYWGSFSESLFGPPSVQVSLQAMLSSLDAKTILFATRKNAGRAAIGGDPVLPVMISVGELPGADEQNRPGLAPPVRKRLLGLVAAFLNDPCGSFAAGKTLPGAKTPNPDVSGRAATAGTATIRIGTTGVAGPVVAAKDTAPYDLYRIEVSYTFDSGKRLLPGTGVGPKGHVGMAVTVHGGKMTMAVDWFAARTGQPPVLPAYDTGHPNIIPAGGRMVSSGVTPSPDGLLPSHEYAGHYEYFVLDPSAVSVVAAVPPFLESSAKQVAKQSGAYYSAGVLWDFQGASGPNPFVGRTNAGQPNISLPQVTPPNQGNPPPPGNLGGGQSGPLSNA